jgi:hydroxymethylbilane synthase
VKELEEALLAGTIDLAVHSMKDVPASLPEGLVIGAVLERADARDVLCGRPGVTMDTLPEGALLGTSSLRRACQLRARRPDLRIESLRGNVDTRLRKLEDGTLAGIVLAAAGLQRLGYSDRISEYLSPAVCLPAIGQGALAIELAVAAPARQLFARLTHEPTERAVAAERAFLERLAGDCQTPVAAHAVFDAGTLAIDGLVGSVDGTTILRDRVGGAAWDADALGRALAERLLERGADAIISQAREAATGPVGGA